MTRRTKASHGFWAAVACMTMAGCSDGGSLAPVDDLTPLVGDWDAYVLQVSVPGSPDLSRDLLEDGATFRINVQPSGQYTAVLSLLAASQVEIGTLVRDGDQLTLYRAVPSPDTSMATYTELAPDRMRLDGTTRFDFEGDGSVEEAALLTELLRVDGAS